MKYIKFHSDTKFIFSRLRNKKQFEVLFFLVMGYKLKTNDSINEKIVYGKN